jgi:hypothetical protein
VHWHITILSHSFTNSLQKSRIITEAMVKMSEADAQKVQQATGTPPEDMSHEELQQTMQRQNIQPQPVTQEDQQAMASAEAADPQSGAES